LEDPVPSTTLSRGASRHTSPSIFPLRFMQFHNSMGRAEAAVGHGTTSSRASQMRKHARRGRAVVFVDTWPEQEQGGGAKYARVIVRLRGQLVCKLLAPRSVTKSVLQNAIWQELDVPLQDREAMFNSAMKWETHRPLARADCGVSIVDIGPGHPLGGTWTISGEARCIGRENPSYIAPIQGPLTPARATGSAAPLLARFMPGSVLAALAGGGDLHCAVLLGDLEACHALVQQGQPGTLRSRDCCGRSALHLAAACGYADVCAAILRHPHFGEAHAALLDINGCTAYQLAPPHVRAVFKAIHIAQVVSAASGSSSTEQFLGFGA